MREFLEMGGYAQYVWPAYGLGFIVLAWNVWSARAMHRDALERARRRAATGPGEESGHGPV